VSVIRGVSADRLPAAPAGRVEQTGQGIDKVDQERLETFPRPGCPIDAGAFVEKVRGSYPGCR
jgi:hypothetical protein